MKKYLVAYGAPGLLVALCIPMVLGLVPPNRFYGFRTSKTLRDTGIWYAANRASGWFMIAAGALAICFNLALNSMRPEWPESRLLIWMVNAMSGFTLLAFAASFVCLRKL